MKREILLLIFALIISGNIFAQDTNDEIVGEATICVVEKNAHFPGGALQNFVDKNLRNPTNGQGQVIVEFTITEKGKIVEPQIVQSVSPELDKEALRIVSLMPDWKPAVQRGKEASVKFTLPINFETSEMLFAKQTKKVAENIITNIGRFVISADFSLEETGKNSYNTLGKFVLRNEKFMMEMSETQIWFDGKTMWTYSPQTNEVSITEPDKKELETINPLLLITDVNETGTKTYLHRGKNAVVVFTPETSKADFEKIEFSVEISSHHPTKIEIFRKDESKMIFEMTNYKLNKDIADSTFVFNKNKYKDVFVNDLR